MIRDLHPKKESTITTYDSYLNKRKVTKKLDFVKSPTDIVDNYIVDNLSDKDVSQKYSSRQNH